MCWLPNGFAFSVWDGISQAGDPPDAFWPDQLFFPKFEKNHFTTKNLSQRRETTFPPIGGFGFSLFRKKFKLRYRSAGSARTWTLLKIWLYSSAFCKKLFRAKIMLQSSQNFINWVSRPSSRRVANVCKGHVSRRARSHWRTMARQWRKKKKERI